MSDCQEAQRATIGRIGATVSPTAEIRFTSGYVRNAISHYDQLDPRVELIERPFTMAALLNKIPQLLGSP